MALCRSRLAGRFGARAQEVFLIGNRRAAVCQSQLTFPRPNRKQRVGKPKAVAAILCRSNHEGGNVGNGECVVLRWRVVNGVGVQSWPLLRNVLHHRRWRNLTWQQRCGSNGPFPLLHACERDVKPRFAPRRADPLFFYLTRISNRKKAFNQWDDFSALMCSRHTCALSHACSRFLTLMLSSTSMCPSSLPLTLKRQNCPLS